MAAATRVGRLGRPPGRCAPCAAALLLCVGAAQAQVAGSLDLASENRYRGMATEDVGPVLRASAMLDSPFVATAGAYAGVSGLWRTRDGGLANAAAMVGWSGRLDAFAPFADVDPGWGWDVAVRRMHYGEGSRYDFSEAMLGALAPGWSARAWWAPHYFGGTAAALYGEVDASRDIGERWRVFAHVGHLRYYGYPGTGQGRQAPRTDALAGVGRAVGSWDVRLTRDGLVSGAPPDGAGSRRRRAAWVLEASVAF